MDSCLLVILGLSYGGLLADWRTGAVMGLGEQERRVVVDEVENEYKSAGCPATCSNFHAGALMLTMGVGESSAATRFSSKPTQAARVALIPTAA
jgi:hypothetical protein